MLDPRARRDQNGTPRGTWRSAALDVTSLITEDVQCGLGEAQNPGPADHEETEHKKKPGRDGPALTRQVTQFQEVRTPSRREFGIYSLQTSRHRSPITHTHLR